MFEISEAFAHGLWIIPILMFLIIIHEIGHFAAARSVGVTVEEFGLGIPPRVKGWTYKGVLWSLNAIPFGGFVRVLGEDGASMAPGSMNTKGPGQRAFFLAAGSAMNLLAAIVLSIALVGFLGVPPESDRVYIDQVMPNSPAAGAGWQPGDEIVAIEGSRIDEPSSLSSSIDRFAGQQITVDIQRGEQTLRTTITPRENPPQNEGRTGIRIAESGPSTVEVTAVTPQSVAAAAGWQPGDEIVAVNGLPIESSVQADAALRASIGRPVEVVLERDGEMVTTTVTVPPRGVRLTEVADDGAAAEAGLYPSDEITSINGVATHESGNFLLALDAARGTTVPITYVRNGESHEARLAVPAYEDSANPLTAIGINATEISPYSAIGADGIISPEFQSVGLAEVIPKGLDQFWFITEQTFTGLKLLLTGGVDVRQTVGPVGMGQLTSELLGESGLPTWVVLTQITIVISLNLAVLNLMPLPALDGGRLLFVLIEVLRGGKRIAPEKEGLVHLAGMVVLLGLMFLVMFGDVNRIINGDNLLP
ncbi:MAG: site-2 protease family protein [Chloroflexota bacterium]|nr:site-2 protease family protein [Chloroflexota bacterium]